MNEDVTGHAAAGITGSEAARPSAAELPKVERWAPYIGALSIALPTLLTYYPPMSDLPLHEGVVGVLRHFGDREYFPRNIYELNFGHPNQLFHLSSALLSFAVGTRWAVKIVIAAAQLAIFHAGVRLADHLGRSRWAVMLLAPIALGFTYYWGLVANLLGFAAFLLSLPTLDRAVASPTRTNTLRAVAMMVLLYLAHESTFATATGVVFLFTIARPLDRRLTPLRLVPAVFAIALGLGHLKWQNAHFPKWSNMDEPPRWFSLSEKLKFLPNALFGSHEFFEQLLLLGLGLTGIGALLYFRVRDDAAPPAEERGLRRARELLLRFRFECLALVYLAMYFALPFNWNGVTLLHERFLGPAWGTLVLCVAPRGITPRLAKFAGTVLPVGILLVSWPQFIAASNAYRALDNVLAHVVKGKTSTLCALDRPIYFQRTFSAGPGPSRALAERGGRSGLSLSDSPISPIRIKPEFEWRENGLRVHAYGSRAFMPTHDFKRYEYVIAASRDPSLRRKLALAFAPDAELVYEEGEWLLFHSRRPSLPMDAPDEQPPPEALDDTILHRVLRIEKQERSGPSVLAPVPTADVPSSE